jgi:hypothetical protein
MIVNLLRFAFRESTTSEERDEVLAAMRRTAGVDSVAFSVVGRDLGDPAEGYSHTYCVGVADLDALERYMYDPVHPEGDFVILPRLARLSAVRFSDDPDPELASRIGAIAHGKLAAYPEWRELLDAIPQSSVLPQDNTGS